MEFRCGSLRFAKERFITASLYSTKQRMGLQFVDCTLRYKSNSSLKLSLQLCSGVLEVIFLNICVLSVEVKFCFCFALFLLVMEVSSATSQLFSMFTSESTWTIPPSFSPTDILVPTVSGSTNRLVSALSMSYIGKLAVLHLRQTD